MTLEPQVMSNMGIMEKVVITRQILLQCQIFRQYDWLDTADDPWHSWRYADTSGIIIMNQA